jgi:hypothetical protein
MEALLQPVADVLSEALCQTPAATTADTLAAPTTTKPGAKAAGGRASTAGGAAAAAAKAGPQLLSLQLLLDPQLNCFPWEALSLVRASCSSVARCFSLVQFAGLLQLPVAPLQLSKLGHLVDPLHHMSDAMEQPGCYAPPLLQGFRWVWLAVRPRRSA